MRKVNNVISIAFAATLLFVFSKPAIFSRAARESQQTSAVDDGLRAITLDFGLRDQQPRSWSGSVSISSGTIVKLRGYHFGAGDKIIGDHSWEAATKPWPEVWTF